MSHHKRKRAKNQRAGCLCGSKDQKHNGWARRIKVRGVKRPLKRCEIAELAKEDRP
jgi:hypothetical protein